MPKLHAATYRAMKKCGCLSFLFQVSTAQLQFCHALQLPCHKSFFTLCSRALPHTAANLSRDISLIPNALFEPLNFEETNPHEIEY
jgi:hypothetical protein